MIAGLMRRGGWVVIGVLAASVVVAVMLAYQAISAARSRQAVSDAMVRQYAQLAAFEFSRVVRRDIDMTLSRTLAAFVHPERRTSDGSCNCAPLTRIDYWFEIGPDGAVVERSGPIPAALREEVVRVARQGRSADGSGRFRVLSSDPQRLVALRNEPHVTSGGSQIGLVAGIDTLLPMLRAAYRSCELLPAIIVGGRDARGLVDLHVDTVATRSLFDSPDTATGAQVVTTDLVPEDPVGLTIRASMTPAFVATLGREHGGGPSVTLVGGLLIVNVLMVGVGLWLVKRERDLARLREDFVAGVSHELRTPLAQIRMFADTLLLERIRNPGEGRRALEIIGQETRRLSQLVENVLYFHRHRRAPTAPPGAAMDLTTFVLEVTEGFKPLAASKRVRLALNIPAHETIAVASADGLRQVLLNLLDNAVKFGPPGGTVTVSLRVDEGVANLSVEDEGPGVPAGERRRIFEPFERGALRDSGGAGIGLAVVHQIVAEHGGTVRVEDAPSGGARFVVAVPAG
jgi:signal transduction histidine kinase